MSVTTAVFCVGGDWEGNLCRTVAKPGCSGLFPVGGPKCVMIRHKLLFPQTLNVTNWGHLAASFCVDD